MSFGDLLLSPGTPAALVVHDAAPAQVFEVRNLVIAAGTDWSQVPHLVGDLGDVDASGVWLAHCYIALDAAAPDNLYFGLDDVEQGSSGVATSVGGASTYWDAQSGVQDLKTFRNVRSNPSPATIPLQFRIWGDGPTTTDITIVHAHAAFSII